MPAVSTRRYVLFCGIAGGGCAVDLLTKHVAFDRLGMPGGTSYWLIHEVFGFTTSLNEGALFGIGQGQGMFFSALSLVAALGIGYWLFVAGAARDLWLTVALACVTAGILGNLYDRLGLPGLVWEPGYGHAPFERVYAVRDWLHFKIEPIIDWPIFNIADSLLVCGAGLMIIHALRVEKIAKSVTAASQEVK
jgi:signal peptidase II